MCCVVLECVCVCSASVNTPHYEYLIKPFMCFVYIYIHVYRLIGVHVHACMYNYCQTVLLVHGTQLTVSTHNA